MYHVSATTHWTITCFSYLFSPLPAGVYLVVQEARHSPRGAVDPFALDSITGAILLTALLVAGIAVAWAIPRFIVVSPCPECGGRVKYDGNAPPADRVVYRCTACGKCIRTGWPSAGGGMA